ncbi:MAG: hypothetical protein UR93_C0004G0013 [Berkelbacteria bacterium GW2011_GWA2_35_9]|uniref:Uncharacterized protein n=1 Tax=Berkelbacteria bacterium GW2011_GWA2_35_9 TaxID=1618333 RepID=A0A0G0FNI6_9BACT|nr:MAG: hypothetical protein UR93_C0004G0013 [Berkelbacteria bacterium GW2011_GWA2_35_9]
MGNKLTNLTNLVIMVKTIIRTLKARSTMSEFNIVGDFVSNTYLCFTGLLYSLKKIRYTQDIDKLTEQMVNAWISGVISILNETDFFHLRSKIENESSNYNLLALKHFLDLLIESKKRLGNPANKERYNILIETIENILTPPPPAREGIILQKYSNKFEYFWLPG